MAAEASRTNAFAPRSVNNPYNPYAKANRRSSADGRENGGPGNAADTRHPAATFKRQRTSSSGGGGDRADTALVPSYFLPQTCLSMLQNTKRRTHISIGCEVLNEALRGGVPMQGLTEVAGEAGVGKTQTCLQLALQAVLPVDRGGLGGRALVINCGEGVFPSNRLAKMATATTGESNVSQLLDAVFVFTPRNIEEQHEVITKRLPEMMDRLQLKIVLVDSISGLFRTDLTWKRNDLTLRNRMLYQMAQTMKELSDKHCTAFVVVNQIEHINNVSPHICNIFTGLNAGATRRVVSDHAVRTERFISVELSPLLPRLQIEFCICEAGVRGVDHAAAAAAEAAATAAAAAAQAQIEAAAAAAAAQAEAARAAENAAAAAAALEVAMAAEAAAAAAAIIAAEAATPEAPDPRKRLRFST